MKHKTQITKIVEQAKNSDKKADSTLKSNHVNTLNYPSGEYFEGIGRRKTAVARVRIYKSEGDIIVNDQLASSYFEDISLAAKRYLLPFELTKTKGEFAVTIKVLSLIHI